MTGYQAADESRQIARITVIGMVVNLILAVVKLAVGYLINSMSLIADGWHSFSDLISDVVVLIGAWISGKPPDRSHPYGHGKFETLSAFGVAVILIIIGVLLTRESFLSFLKSDHSTKSTLIIIVAAFSLVSKEVLYQITAHIAKKLHSSSLKANAWHHRSDALSSGVVLLAGVAEMIGIHYGDSVAGVIVGLMVAGVGVKVGFEALQDLMEVSAGDEVVERFKQAIADNSEVRGWHRLRVRKIGRELDMDVHILLDPKLTIEAGHEIVDKLEQSMRQATEWSGNFTIHVDPDIRTIREASSHVRDSVFR